MYLIALADWGLQFNVQCCGCNAVDENRRELIASLAIVQSLKTTIEETFDKWLLHFRFVETPWVPEPIYRFE